ncbi:MAG: IS4 family transposase [Candidatus Latescibacter sp.]|nr:IS4 family transposase [Candidatus Latescibacter sp.]
MIRNTVFSQLMQLICQYRFKKCVDQYEGDKYTKRFSCWQQLIVLLFAQAKSLTSLRDIELSLKSHMKKWYHLGLKTVAKSTLSDANNNRNADIFRDTFYSLLEKCRELSPRHGFRFKNPLYSFDSTLIDVCLSLYPWATYRTKKGAFKLHTLLDHSGYLPSFMVITDGKTHDINVVKDDSYGFPSLSPDSILLIDRAYIDYNWLYSLTRSKLFFVMKAKSNMKYTVLGQQEVTKNKGIVSDCLIMLSGVASHENYPDKLRMVTYIDHETGELYVFITNNFKLAARTIADLYKSRWQIETFFKWIKQNLKIKSFLGTSKNAVMSQIWAAMIYYLLLSFIKFQTKCRHSLHELTRIVGELLLDSIYLVEILTIPFDRFKTITQKQQQLSLPLKF